MPPHAEEVAEEVELAVRSWLTFWLAKSRPKEAPTTISCAANEKSARIRLPKLPRCSRLCRRRSLGSGASLATGAPVEHEPRPKGGKACSASSLPSSSSNVTMADTTRCASEPWCSSYSSPALVALSWACSFRSCRARRQSPRRSQHEGGPRRSALIRSSPFWCSSIRCSSGTFCCARERRRPFRRQSVTPSSCTRHFSSAMKRCTCSTAPWRSETSRWSDLTLAGSALRVSEVVRVMAAASFCSSRCSRDSACRFKVRPTIWRTWSCVTFSGSPRSSME
mmetsp:Transcript_20409/g.51698  ORF Transcript_20409/g.51698 Transcript_20409/m.51698 type:complete len:280 (-) Transcript_20409:1255-2094(-)